MMWSPLYFVFGLPALLLALYAQWRVRATYKKYLRVPNAMGVSGSQAAQTLLRATGLSLRVEGVAGELSDHYDPRAKVLRLSNGVSHSSSVGAVAIVAHEFGHALQDSQSFALLSLRSGLVPVVNLTSWLGPILFAVGMIFGLAGLAELGIWFFGGAVIFALLTLPVELDASRRGMQLLRQNKILEQPDALRGARQVLSAAALTYVAALAQSLSTLLYYVFILNGSRGRRRR